MILIYTSATTRNLISVSLSFRLQKKAENHFKKWEERGGNNNRRKKIPVVSIAHVTAFERSVRKQCVNTTGLLCGFPPKPLPWG